MKMTGGSSEEYDRFNSAMDRILKADPKAVKAAMEVEKQDRKNKRKTKKHPSVSGHVSVDKG
jgi:hypothetical protein